MAADTHASTAPNLPDYERARAELAVGDRRLLVTTVALCGVAGHPPP